MIAFQPLIASTVTAVLLTVFVSIRYLRRTSHIIARAGTKPDHLNRTEGLPKLTALSQSLLNSLLNSVIRLDSLAFKQVVNSYWAQQECEVVPACIVRPSDVQQLCTVVVILKREYDNQGKRSSTETDRRLFAVRGGGHSPVSGAANLGLFRDLIPSEDGLSVELRAGGRWMDVAKVLDEKGLAVVGGRTPPLAWAV